MKRICLETLFLLSVVLLHAQKVTENPFSVLANEKSVVLKIDYSESIIDGQPFEMFLEEEEQWDKTLYEITVKLIKSANKNSSGILYYIKKETNCQLVFQATSVDRDGATSGYLLLLDKDEHIIGKSDKFSVKGGSFGSQTNLMGDGAVHLGRKIANFINRQVK